jgi:hypothetical protein
MFLLSFLTIRLLARGSAGGYPTPPFFHLFFSDTIHMKAWLASGAITLALTLPVAYHCIFLLGFDTTSPRVAIHSILGSTFYGAFLVKVILVRSGGLPRWALPVAGGLLFAILGGLWLTSYSIFSGAIR